MTVLIQCLLYVMCLIYLRRILKDRNDNRLFCFVQIVFFYILLSVDDVSRQRRDADLSSFRYVKALNSR